MRRTWWMAAVVVALLVGTVAQAEVDYWSKATATDATNQAWITLQLQTARARLTNLQSQQTINS